MFRIFSIVLLMFVCTANIYAQEYKDSIQAQFLRYTESLKNKDYIGSAEYINPNLFKIIPKARLVQAMENAYNNPQLEFDMKEAKIVSIDDSREIKGEHYAKFRYSNYLVIRYKEQDDEERDVEEEMESFQSTFGEKNVTYDADADSYTVFVTKEVIANSKDLRRWTFVVLEDRQKPMLEKFIPKELF